MSDIITVATTIAPQGDLINQVVALDSWIAAGFNIIAVNTAEEIQYLKSFFPKIEFYPASANGRAKFGKPFIYLDQIFAALSEKGTNICGIINSDIHLACKNLKEVVARECQNAFVFGARLDVMSLDNSNDAMWYRGFDYFFFEQKLINLYPAEEFCLGLPWWDYWIVLIPLSRGITVKRVVSPAVKHIIHSARYSLEAWFYLGQVLSKYFRPAFNLTTDTIGVYNGIMFQLIDKNPKVKSITLPG